MLGNVPHVACNVWLRGCFKFVPIYKVYTMRTNSPLTRCEQRAVHYLAMRTNSLLTPCKQGAVLSRYSIFLGTFTLLHGLAMRTNTILTRPQATCGTFLTSEYSLRRKKCQPRFSQTGAGFTNHEKTVSLTNALTWIWDVEAFFCHFDIAKVQITYKRTK